MNSRYYSLLKIFLNDLFDKEISNLKVVRTTLLSGLLRTLSESKHMPLPLKIFEASDVVLKDLTTGIWLILE